MSKQALSLQNDWEQIKEEFQEHFREKNLEIEEEKLKYERSGEHLTIIKDGRVSAGMPLHSNELQNAKEIDFTDSGVKVISEKSTYEFRR